MSPKRKRELKEAAGHRCDICMRTGRPIEIHHRDRNRKNNADDNLQVLCPECHKNVHRGLTWSDELSDWDTEWNRQLAEINRHLAVTPKQTIVITLDAAVLADLRVMAIQTLGHEDIGEYLSRTRLRDASYLLKATAA